jgi:hypothetical protein
MMPSTAPVLYDVHTHVGIDAGFYLRGWWPYAATAQDLLRQMDCAGIGRGVCFPFCLPSAFDAEAFVGGRVELRAGRVPFDHENRLLLQEIERIDLDRRLSVLAMFDPSRRVREQVGNLRPLIGKITGLKVQATILQSPIAALLKEGRPLMELAAEQDLPVLFHTSIIASDLWSQTADCLAVAEAFPTVRFNLAHSLRFHLPSLKRAAELPNVWVDCSAHLVHCQLACDDLAMVAQKGERVEADFSRPVEVLKTIHALLGGRYMWGSDNPYQSWCDDTLRAVYTYQQEADVLHALPEAIRRSMGHDAPRAWLGHS